MNFAMNKLQNYQWVVKHRWLLDHWVGLLGVKLLLLLTLQQLQLHHMHNLVVFTVELLLMQLMLKFVMMSILNFMVEMLVLLIFYEVWNVNQLLLLPYMNNYMPFMRFLINVKMPLLNNGTRIDLPIVNLLHINKSVPILPSNHINLHNNKCLFPNILKYHHNHHNTHNSLMLHHHSQHQVKAPLVILFLEINKCFIILLVVHNQLLAVVLEPIRHDLFLVVLAMMLLKSN
mmetsp:Transcript_5602/g.7933  ORF Transcript_5602/g.7933 Transcript_5602/m.7933 type:complete len:231 (-) Transcript_5602:1887-2579(-)